MRWAPAFALAAAFGGMVCMWLPSARGEGGAASHPASPPPRPATQVLPQAPPAAVAASAAAVRTTVAFGRTAGPADAPRLLEMAREADPLACGTAIRALARLGLLHQLGDLTPWLHDARLRVRQEIVLACESSSDPVHLELLVAATRDDDERVRAIAEVALARRRSISERTLLSR